MSGMDANMDAIQSAATPRKSDTKKRFLLWTFFFVNFQRATGGFSFLCGPVQYTIFISNITNMFTAPHDLYFAFQRDCRFFNIFNCAALACLKMVPQEKKK